MTTTPKRVSAYDLMAVDVPEGTHGTVAVERFEIGRNDLANLREAWHGGRDALPGTYTKLTRNGRLWMSDTTAERRDHGSVAAEIMRAGRLSEQGETDPDGARILIGGLGLGMILRVALLTPGVGHVDVVEIDPDVIALVGPHYQAMADEHGVSLAIYRNDVYDVKWPVGTRWSVVWFDIWPDLCTDNLASMAKLRRSYGRRAGWCECWGRHMLLRHRQQERRTAWW